MFFEFCQESGYEKILQVLGSTIPDFLQNLDALHDHLAFIYPGMRAPSFRCSEGPDKGSILLHYYSERDGLEHIVIGLVKAVAQSLHSSEVQVDIYKRKESEIDHVQFLIRDKVPKDSESSEEDQATALTTEKNPLVSPFTFSKAFPFHLIFDRTMFIFQTGKSIERLFPGISNGSAKMSDIFTIMRPYMKMTFENILEHTNTVFVLKSKSVRSPCGRELVTHRFKGEMIYVKRRDCIVFLCSPNVASLDDMCNKGLSLSEIPLHDATRDLTLLSEQFGTEYKLTQRLEILTDQLQQTYRDLETEKAKTDR